VGFLSSRPISKGTRLQLLTFVSHFTRSRSVAAILGIDPSLSSLAFLATALVFEASEKKGDVYNILWALVFGFATLNILGLVVKRFEPRQNRMSFGELLAVLTVVVSIFLLGWEMLYLFKVFPIRLSGH
jgi:hypothetical protein